MMFICFDLVQAYDDSVRDEAIAKGDKKTVFKYSSESEHASQLMDELIQRVKTTEDEVDQSLKCKLIFKAS